MAFPNAPVTAPAAPQPVIDRLRRLLKRGIELSEARRLGSRELRYWISLVRSVLSAVYGDGPQLAGFPKIATDPTADELREIWKERVEHLQRFIEGLDTLLKSLRPLYSVNEYSLATVAHRYGENSRT